jgi:hypothetical protein
VVPVRVGERRHPQLGVPVAVHHAGWPVEPHAGGGEPAVLGVDVRDPEVQDAAAGELGAFRHPQVEAHVAAGEECHRLPRHPEQQRDLEHVGVEAHCPVQVRDADVDLAQRSDRHAVAFLWKMINGH